jgi:hypothetical protein
MLTKLALLLFLAHCLFAGDSLVPSNQIASNSSIPAPAAGTPWAVQLYLDVIPQTLVTNPTYPVVSNSTGFGFYLEAVNGCGGVCLETEMTNETGQTGFGGFAISGTPSDAGYLTLVHDTLAAGGAHSNTDTIYIWDKNNNLLTTQSQTYSTNTANGIGFEVSGGTDAWHFAFVRACSGAAVTTIANRMPTTAGGCPAGTEIFEWKFDGNLSDSSGNGYTATLNTGSASYAATLYQNVIAAMCSVLCSAVPPWSTSVPAGALAPSWAAGTTVQLDGSLSFSEADSSNAISSYAWSMLSSPTPPTWSSTSIASPTLSGVISTVPSATDYEPQLVVTDTAMNTATISSHVGAVTQNSGGIVNTGNSTMDATLGSLIAWGKNPWGYQDWWHEDAMTLRLAYYQSNQTAQGLTFPGWATQGKPQWETYGTGTISYYFNGVGNLYYLNPSLGTTLNGSCSSTATSCAVTACSGLDFTSTPTRIVIFDGTNWDEDRATACTGNVVTFAYDPSALPRHSFATGVNVLQSKVTGSGTKFVTDSNVPVCPVGAPGLPGLASYSTGTAGLTAGSTAMTGSGTAWMSSGAVYAGNFVQVSATNSSLAAFTFMAVIATVNSDTSITLARPFPPDATTATGLTYYVMPATRTPVLHYQNAFTDPTYDPTGDSQLMFGTTGCESETAFYINPAGGNNFGLGNQFAGVHDVSTPSGGSLDGQHFTGQHWSVTDVTGWVNETATGGINFYGEGLASRELFYRSGLTQAYTAAGLIDNYWLHSPWGNADGNGYPRLYLGGGGIGAWVSYLTDSATKVTISNLRGYADIGAAYVTDIASMGCNAFDDTRDTGYAYAWLIYGAIYDPDTSSTSAPGGVSWSAYWRSFLTQMEANDTLCANADYSFANGYLWNASFPVLTMTNGSAIATGTGLPSTLCNGIATGSATVVNGSNAITATAGSFPSGTALFLTGTTGGGASVFVQNLAYSGTGSSAVLGGYWLGDSGTITWLAGSWDGNPGSGSALDMMTIATSENDLTDLKKSWACTLNSSTQITLNRAWDGPSSSVSVIYRPYVANLAGFGQQPFMLGIKSYGMNLLATQTVPALSSFKAPYAALAAGSTGWIWNTGMDHQLFGTNYGRIYQTCEPTNTAPTGTDFDFRAPGCTYGFSYAFLSTEQNSETGRAHTIYYANNPSSANLTLGDEFYGSLWGYCPWTTGGAYCSANSTAANAAQSNLGLPSGVASGKWYGFFTGIGFSSGWPAYRQGIGATSVPVGIGAQVSAAVP